MPLIGPFTGAQGLREPFSRQLFHVRASYFDETERIVQHLTTLGVKNSNGFGGQFFNVSFVGSSALAEELGEAGSGVVISQVVPFPFQGSSVILREYQQRMTESGQKEFDFSSFEGFLAAEGLKRAGRGLSREGLILALESLKDFNMGGFTINYSAKSHEGSNFSDLTIIGRGGKFIH